MTAVVLYMVDDVVMEERFDGERIIAKIHGDRRGFVRCDGVVTLYARVEKIVIGRA